MIGGNDLLQGISVYDGGDYWHFVSCGLSELYYNKEITEQKTTEKIGIDLTDYTRASVL